MLVQERRNYIANALELWLFCNYPSIWGLFYQVNFPVIMSSQILPQKHSVALNISFGRIPMILQLYGSLVRSRFLSITRWVLLSLIGRHYEDIRVGGFLLPQSGRPCEFNFIVCRFTGFKTIISRRLPNRSQYCYWWYDTVWSRYLTGIQTKIWIPHSLPLHGQSMGWLL